MTAPARVVALVPTYNGAAFVAATLASLAAQDHPALTVLVSDDASTDETHAICAAAAARDPRVTLLRQPTRLGWIGNSNTLLARADGDYAFFAPHDDLFAPTYVSQLLAALAARPDAVLAYADTVGIEPDGRESLRTAARVVQPGGRVRRGLAWVLVDTWDRWTPFRGLVRMAVLRRVGGLRPSRAGEPEADGRWLFRLNLLGPFVRVPEVLCWKRIHPTSLNRSWSRWRRVQLATRAAYVREVLAADLRPAERAALLAAIGAAIALRVLPWHLRSPIAGTLRRLGV